MVDMIAGLVRLQDLFDARQLVGVDKWRQANIVCFGGPVGKQLSF
jgi:hypothetical protein